MARKATRVYVPLDAGFFDDNRVIEAGEAAGWLLLSMFCRVKLLDTDGVLSSQQMSRLGVPGWRRRLARLIAVGLVLESPAGSGTYVIRSWTKWNDTQAERAEKQEADRKRKGAAAAAKAAQQAASGRLSVIDGSA